MKFANVMLCLLFVFGVCACGGGGNSNVSANGTISHIAVGQNGITTSPWGDGSLSQHPAMAVKFTPTTYPMTITSVTIYPKNNTGTDQKFNLYGFSDLASENQIFSPVLNQSIQDTGTSYTAKTISIPATTITSGSFYIAVEWVTKPLTSASGTNTFLLRTDGHLDFTNTSFVRYTGSIWSSLESVNAMAGDLGIAVNYGDVATGDKPVIASTFPLTNAVSINRNTQELVIQFNKEMATGYSIIGDVNWPLSNSTPVRWSSDHMTIYIPRDNPNSNLPQNTSISLTFNGPGHSLNFMDIFCNTLDPYTLTFTTGL